MLLITDPSLSATTRTTRRTPRGRRSSASSSTTTSPSTRPRRWACRRIRPTSPNSARRRSTSTRSTAPGPVAQPAALRPGRPRQAPDRVRRPVRGPAARGGRHGDHRRSAERREPDHRRAALRVRPVPQRAVDRAREPRGSRRRRGVSPRRGSSTTWHYHWLVVHEFLPQFVGQAMVDDVLANGRPLLHAGTRRGFIPVEFQGAATASATRWCARPTAPTWPGDDGKPFFGLSSTRPQDGRPDPADLRGGCRAPRRFIGWQTFFDFGDGTGQAEQADRHEHLDAALPPAARRDRQPRPADGAAAAQPPAPAHLERCPRASRSPR